MPLLCIYSRLEGNIHEYVFTQSSKAAVDEWLAIAQEIVMNTQPLPDHISRVLFDTRQSGPMPMFYAFQRSAEWNKQIAALYRPQLQKTAYVYPRRDQAYNTIMNQLAKIFAPAYFAPKYFAEDREAAIAWLRTDER